MAPAFAAKRGGGAAQPPRPLFFARRPAQAPKAAGARSEPVRDGAPCE